MAIVHEDGNKQERDELKKINLEDFAGVSATVEHDAEADYFDRANPPLTGVYGGKLFLDRDGWKTADGHFFVGLEIRLEDFVSHPELKEEYLNYNVLSRVATTIPQGKKTSSMATILAKAGVPVEKLKTSHQTAQIFNAWLKKEPLVYFLLDWRAWSTEFDNGAKKEPGRMIHYHASDFPKGVDGEPLMEFEYTHKNGSREKLRAKAYAAAFYKNIQDARSQATGVKPSAGGGGGAKGMVTVNREATQVVIPHTTESHTAAVVTKPQEIDPNDFLANLNNLK